MLARTQLWILAFTGFMVNYMVRINLNIAIVAMVQRKEDTSQGSGPPHVAFCRQNNDQQRANVTEVHVSSNCSHQKEKVKTII
jgi:BioD-like phosphotransacetylase family protein